MEKFLNIMIEKILPDQSEKFFSAEDSEMWKQLVDKNNNLTRSATCLLVFRLIQSLLSPCRISSKILQDVENTKNVSKKFYSLRESRDAFLIKCTNETDLNEKVSIKLAKESSVSPYIFIVGSLNQAQAFIVNFENITYKFHSLTKAIDICFKAYTLFNIAYPEACSSVWDIINRVFYKLPDDNTNTKPSTYLLINEIRTAMEQ
ncbi:uncharacterized protein LOC129771953 [Toxorhynchites rutilus septentrionalis]|uniref:uncharacterized protein LOC129771953 n=1 Tax=Toxorhynchites rutilus septentrionalis TaxID=329112 RepID=UPI002479F2B3|nr:uncharacterized protein LOC129771953 [Toxorhynchites rutilus septentrionalis]